jgi:hypothetical protein
MAKNENETVTNTEWSQLTDADVTAIRVQNLGSYPLWLMATAGATPPSTTSGAIRLGAGLTMAADLTLDDLWPGVAGTRVYALVDYSAPPAASVIASVSHA